MWIAFIIHAYVRLRNNMSMRFHTTILCVFECEKTCGLRFHNTSDWWTSYGRPIRPCPLNFPHNLLRKISTDNMSIFLIYIQFQNSIYRFPKENKHLYWNRFIFEKICFNHYHAMQFAIFLFIWLQNLTLPLIKIKRFRPGLLPGLRPWTHWGLPYLKHRNTAPNSRS